MTELEKLKKRLLSKENSKDDALNLCAIMEIVGGYSQLMELPIPAIEVIKKYLEYKNKQQKKSMKKGKI